jgi:proline dehydrogenase
MDSGKVMRFATRRSNSYSNPVQFRYIYGIAMISYENNREYHNRENYLYVNRLITSENKTGYGR